MFVGKVSLRPAKLFENKELEGIRIRSTKHFFRRHNKQMHVVIVIVIVIQIIQNFFHSLKKEGLLKPWVRIAKDELEIVDLLFRPLYTGLYITWKNYYREWR